MLDVICFLVLELCMQENSEFNIFFVFLFAKQRHELESNTRKDSTPWIMISHFIAVAVTSDLQVGTQELEF